MPPYTRWQRGARAISGFASGTSRLARPPRQLVRPAVRPGGCVPPSPLLIHDNFDRPSYPSTLGGSTSTSGHTWTHYRGAFTIDEKAPSIGVLNSAAYCSTSSTGQRPALVGFDYGTTDVHLAARIAVETGSGSRGMFLCFNGAAIASQELYQVAFPSLRVVRIIGAATPVEIIPSISGGANLDVVEVIKSGADFEVYRNGVLMGTGTDASTPLTGTRHGLHIFFADNGPGPDSVYDWGYPYNPCDPEAFV